MESNALGGLQSWAGELSKRNLADALGQPNEPLPEELILSNLVAAARLATSGNSEASAQLAFEIAVRTAELRIDHSQAQLDLLCLVFARRGQFQAIRLLRDRYPNWACGLPMPLQLEMAARIVENAPAMKEDQIFTDFQRDLHFTLQTERRVSIAAPTSAGKSFVFLEVLRKQVAHEGKLVVYVVPTKALIREVQGRIRKALNPNKSIPIRTIPVPLPHLQGGGVYVLTQERLLALLHEYGAARLPDTVFFDEAQGVEDGDRGILLEASINLIQQMAQRDNRQINVYYAAPIIPNPQYLLSLGPHALPGRYHHEDRAAVIQNILHIEPRYASKTWKLDVSLAGSSSSLSLPINEGPPDTAATLRSWLARLVHQPGTTTIVFNDAKSQAEKTATEIAKFHVYERATNPKARALAKYIQKNLHPLHPLVGMLTRGIAFHYRHLPTPVRHGIEDLAADRALDFICTTSTLLQGVNIPCKNIVLCDPKTDTTPLTALQVRNLAGRAGRMRYDFMGNIWFYKPSKWTPPVGESVPVPANMEVKPLRTAFHHAVSDGTLASSLEIATPVTRTGDAALGMAFQVIRSNGTLTTYGENDVDRERLLIVENRLAEESDAITAPLEIIERHVGLDPRKLSDLYAHLAEMPEEAREKFIPRPHRLEDDKENHLWRFLEFKLGKVAQILEPELSKGQLVRRVVIAKQWLKHASIRLIVKQAIFYWSDPKRAAKDRIDPESSADVAQVIREALTILEDEVRFTMVQHSRVLMDVLKHIYRDQPEKLSDVVDLPAILEFGTRNPVTLRLISLGFSRQASREIAARMRKEKLDFPDAESLVLWLGDPALQIASWKISPQTWSEICSVAGRESSEVDWEQDFDEDSDED